MSYMVEVDNNGRILIPAKLRGKLNLHKGDKIALVEEEGIVTLVKKSDRLKEAQALFGAMVGESKDGVGEFLAFRREEAQRERRGLEQQRLES